MEVDAIDGGDGDVGDGAGRRGHEDDGGGGAEDDDDDVSLPWEQYTPEYIGRDCPSSGMVLSPRDGFDDGGDGGGEGGGPCPPHGGGGGLTDPRKSSLRTRWLILLLTCLAMSGPYYAYDVPSSLHQQLEDYMPTPSPSSSSYETRFNLLYTVYSVPNVVLPLFGGSVVDRHGGPRCMAAFAATVCLGSAVLGAGVASKSWAAMYLGRFVFGLGAESMCVAQSTVVSEWFEGREVAFAMGVGLAVSRLGSIWNNVSSPKTANSRGVPAAFWAGTLLTFLSVVLSLLIAVVDKRAIRRLERRRRDGEGLAMGSLTEALLEDVPADVRVPRRPSDEGLPPPDAACKKGSQSGVRVSDVRRFGPLFWLLTLSCVVVYGCVLPFNNVASGVLLERDYFASSPEGCTLEYPGECSNGYLVSGSNPAQYEDGDVCDVMPGQAPVLPSSVNKAKSDTSDARSDGWEEESYVYPSLTPGDVDCGDPFWAGACTRDFCDEQNAATEEAGRVMSIPYLISALSSPPLGHLVDRVGRRAKVAVASSALLLVVHLTLALSSVPPILPMVGQGVAYSLYASVLWPSVPLTVPRRLTGTAFGVITSLQNVGLALFPLAVAGIYRAGGGRYVPGVELFFASCAFAGVAVGVAMNRLDMSQGGRLNGVAREGDGGGEEEVISFDREKEGDFMAVDEDKYFSPLT